MGKARALALTLLGVTLSTTFLGCSSKQLLKRSDYAAAKRALDSGNVTQARRELPSGEENSFIILMERAYLDLLNGNPAIDALQKYARKIESRIKYAASREVAYLFYLETPEGYYASEHEIVWMHMLLSWGYSLRREFDRAVVEAKKSALLLEGKSKEGRFDDPMLRVVLGTLWAMCNRWEDARVDFRVAARMDPKLTWAAALSESYVPPKQFALVLTGSGPEPQWDPKLQLNAIRGIRDLTFQTTPIPRNFSAFDQKGRWMPVYYSPDSMPWYKRHLERDNEIHNLISDSRYGQQVVLSTAKAGATIGVGVVAGVLVVTLSLGLGAAIAYYGGSSDAVGFGLAIMIGGSKLGVQIGDESVRSGVRTASRELDMSDRYRYVRFLPTRAMVIFGDGERPIKLTTGTKIALLDTDIANESAVSIRYVPTEQ